MVTPNHLSVLRLVLAAIIPPVLVSASNVPMVAVVVALFSIGCFTDWWDGHLARKHSMITPFGKITDPIADKCLILGAMGSCAFLGLYSWWWLIPIFARETSVTAVRLLMLARGKVSQAEWAGKIKVGFQVGSVYASLLLYAAILLEKQGSFQNPALRTILSWLNLLAIGLAMTVTILSGISFFCRLKAGAGK